MTVLSPPLINGHIQWTCFSYYNFLTPALPVLLPHYVLYLLLFFLFFCLMIILMRTLLLCGLCNTNALQVSQLIVDLV
jgi:hypothetical protein